MPTFGELRHRLGYSLDLQDVTHFAFLTDQYFEGRLADIEKAPAAGPVECDLREMQGHVFGSVLPRLARYSAVVLAYGVLDATLANLCDEVRDRLKLPFGFRDLRGEGLSCYGLYLRRTMGVDVKKHTWWSVVANVATVRHCLAHAYGDTERMRKPQAVQRAAKALGIEVSATKVLEVPKHAAELIVDQMSGWLDELVGDVEAALPAARPLGANAITRGDTSPSGPHGTTTKKLFK